MTRVTEVPEAKDDGAEGDETDEHSLVGSIGRHGYISDSVSMESEDDTSSGEFHNSPRHSNMPRPAGATSAMQRKPDYSASLPLLFFVFQKTKW